ncbi:FecR family protein [Novosphingobium sp.]|uniref:FecR family protein n=2 Tax=Novosphingobium sp. TaxID=1874826 RepID=UPI002FDA0F01
MTAVEDQARPDRDEEAAAWCLELADGELPAERRVELDLWIQDPENYQSFQRAAEVWDITEAIGSTPEVVRMRAQALEAYRVASAARWRKQGNGRWGRGFWTFAAAAAVAAVFLVVWLMNPAADAYRTGIGKTQVALLEDGSRLSLDADTEVKASFDSRRRSLVLNKGRAKFDVVHNPLRPFSVSVGDKVVVATGTSFSVEKLGGEVHVILFEGHVAILDGDGRAVGSGRQQRPIDDMLKPGSELTLPAVGRGAAHVGQVDLSTSWRQGQVSFDDEPLPLAVERMNRYLPEPLEVADTGAASVRVTGVFEDNDPAGFIDALRQLSGVRAQRQGGRILLSKP